MTVKNEKIVIIGAGTFGLSTALWLLRNNFKNVNIIDPYDLPSEISAGYDINKVIQSAYTEENSLTTSLAIEALEGWQSDPVFYPHFYETGIVYATSKDKDSSEYKQFQAVAKYAEKCNRKFGLQYLESGEEFRKLVPELSGPLENWKGYFQSTECGWAHALNSLISAGKEIKRLGGNFIKGEVEKLLYNEDNTKVVGCSIKDGESVFGDKTIISAGASSVKIFDFKDQLLAKCWTVGHIKLTPDEAKRFKNLPVINNSEKGFFFEPDLVKHEIKICNEFPGYTNYISEDCQPNNSIPVYKDKIPEVAERDMRNLLKETIPELADKEIVETKICWCTDTPDRNFLICEHPDYDGSLILATGDSGHGFKHMPNIGKYIARLVTYGPAALDDEKRTKWRWRPETAKDRIQDRFGGDGHVGDLKDITKWISKL